MKLHEAIGLELERREKVMTFEEWIRQECFKAPPEYAVELAKAAWDYQQARIEALEKREQMLLAECKIMRVEAERLITKLACDGVQRLTEIRPDAGWDSGEVVAAGYIRFLPEPQETDHE